VGAREVPPRRCKHSSAILVRPLSIPATHELGWRVSADRPRQRPALAAQAAREGRAAAWADVLKVIAPALATVRVMPEQTLIVTLTDGSEHALELGGHERMNLELAVSALIGGARSQHELGRDWLTAQDGSKIRKTAVIAVRIGEPGEPSA
jgi:hypothetical protein